MGSFADESEGAVPLEIRGRYRLWLRIDSAGYAEEVVEAAERLTMGDLGLFHATVRELFGNWLM